MVTQTILCLPENKPLKLIATHLSLELYIVHTCIFLGRHWLPSPLEYEEAQWHFLFYPGRLRTQWAENEKFLSFEITTLKQN